MRAVQIGVTSAMIFIAMVHLNCASQDLRRPRARTAVLTEEQAQMLVFQLPTVVAFCDRMERLSGGTVHGMILAESTDADWFEFYVGEDHDDHTVCWNRFQVNRRTREIFMLDDVLADHWTGIEK